jgi:hypothetical protein
MYLKSICSLALFLLPFTLFSQTETKSKQNTFHPNIDFKLQGAPMPKLTFLAYQDTTKSARLPASTSKRKQRRNKNTKLDTTAHGLYRLVHEDELENNASLFVMMFNPTCLHCEDVTFMLEKNIDLFRKTKIVLLANQMMSQYIPDFAQRHHVADYPAMYIGCDSSGFINNLFLYQTLPQINIYSAERKLLKTYCGEVPIDTLRKYID